jgi:hypothetical protein
MVGSDWNRESPAIGYDYCITASTFLPLSGVFQSKIHEIGGGGIIVLEIKGSLSNILTKHKHLKNIKEKAGKLH